MMKKLLLLMAIIMPFFSISQRKYFEKKEFTDSSGFVLPYQIMYPENYDESQKYPLVLFLHGSGERGSDNEKQLTHGAWFFEKYNRSTFPAIVIVPQCPEDSRWANVEHINKEFVYQFNKNLTPPLSAVRQLLMQFIKSGSIDERRLYVGGLSMGGMGTFELLQKMPKTFAAAFPICGGGDPESVKSYTQNTGVWIFHGGADDVVSVKYSAEMYNALKRLDADVKLTIYPNVNHNSWDYAFDETSLMPWLFGHRKCKPCNTK